MELVKNVSLKKNADVMEWVIILELRILLRMGRVLFQLEREERSGKVKKSVISCQTGAAVAEVEQEGRLKLNKLNSMNFVTETEDLPIVVPDL